MVVYFIDFKSNFRIRVVYFIIGGQFLLTSKLSLVVHFPIYGGFY